MVQFASYLRRILFFPRINCPNAFIWEGGLARFTRSRVFQPVSRRAGWKILPYEHFSPVTGMKVGWILWNRMTPSCFACCIFHIISIPFSCSYTDIRVAKACFVSRFFAPEFVSRIFVLISYRKPGWIWEISTQFILWTQGEIGSSKRASPVNRAHVKRPLTL